MLVEPAGRRRADRAGVLVDLAAGVRRALAAGLSVVLRGAQPGRRAGSALLTSGVAEQPRDDEQVGLAAKSTAGERQWWWARERSREAALAQQPDRQAAPMVARPAALAAAGRALEAKPHYCGFRVGSVVQP
ncbi:hypothetical protein [Streptomyces sp. x-19]|uniref:hypothetical protein n=1 Tax=Streptomyces sp. x-19 TaxID=2789280 RepID=UPI00397FECC9